MIYLYKMIGSFVQFPGILILFFVLFSLYFLFKRRQMWRFFIILSIFLYIISTSAFNYVVSKLFYVKEVPIPKTGTIVILGGGITNYSNHVELGSHTQKRLFKGFEVYKNLHQKIILTGGVIGKGTTEADLMKKFLITLGVPENDILVENKSRTTKENAKNVAKIVKEENIILVTSYIHMKRAKMLFEKYTKKNIIPVVCDYPIDFRNNFLDYLPSPQALYTFSQITHEFFGILKGG
ncbi:hypothetical protein XJ44_05155 [Thermosipho affectus]|uniref:DUF218 domain-containing protein n=2 Tax=Thermosipho affectus TaxID=660294 RepID=A0ABX3IIZ9_9BACT|nr:hypothetical protein XJ44_05155 [Thermosipho affectus]